MRRRRSANGAGRGESGSVIVLVLVVLATLGAGWWFLRANRDHREREAWTFANEATKHIVLQRDKHFLDFNLSAEAKLQYPPSWRLRLMDWVQQAGAANPDFHVKGEVTFVHQFLEPRGHFTAQVDCANGPAYLEMRISHPGALWVIDEINWTWNPPPPTPTPTVTPSPSPSPVSPTPTPRRRR